MIELRGPNIHHTLQLQKKKGLTCITAQSACETEKVCKYQSEIHPAISGDRAAAFTVRHILAKYEC